MLRLITILIFVTNLQLVEAHESPRQFVQRFYTAHRSWPFRGVPYLEQERFISPYCGMEIIRIFRRVNDQRDLEERKFSSDPKNPYKPAWSQQGHVFCDVYEGITNFSIGRQFTVKGRMVVEAHLELVEQGKSYPWTDRVILDRAGRNWVIADIEYSGGGSLLESIEGGLQQNAKYLGGDQRTHLKSPNANKP
ncbi:MAG: hypothetical protein CFE26_24140 [Verrucomicrobiales bacterium VVV1]|nr:MAG: hypothetical protein CFE26_24140 [Verrucomicrobiales bacterium VVV1]